MALPVLLNETTVTCFQIGEVVSTSLLFIVFGLLVCVTSSISLIVDTSTPDLRSLYILLILAEIIEIIIGAGHAISGIYWLIDHQSITNCEYTMKSSPMPLRIYMTFFYVAAGASGFMLLVLAVQRLIAFEFYVWYYKFRNSAHRPKIAIMIICFSIYSVYLITIFVANRFFPDSCSDRICSPFNGLGWVISNNIIATIAPIIAFAIICYVHGSLKGRLKATVAFEQQANRNKNQLIKSSLAAFTILLSSNNLITQYVSSFSLIAFGLLRVLFLLHISSYLILYTIFLEDFRQRFFEIFTFKLPCTRTKEEVIAEVVSWV